MKKVKIPMHYVMLLSIALNLVSLFVYLHLIFVNEKYYEQLEIQYNRQVKVGWYDPDRYQNFEDSASIANMFYSIRVLMYVMGPVFKDSIVDTTGQKTQLLSDMYKYLDNTVPVPISIADTARIDYGVNVTVDDSEPFLLTFCFPKYSEDISNKSPNIDSTRKVQAYICRETKIIVIKPDIDFEIINNEHYKNQVLANYVFDIFHEYCHYSLKNYNYSSDQEHAIIKKFEDRVYYLTLNYLHNNHWEFPKISKTNKKIINS